MCGLFAAVGPTLSEREISDVLASLRHRGPDGSGIYRDNSASVTIAHTRLAIIDLATGNQPIESDDGTIIVACNGELYGFEEIRAALLAKGYGFKTKSDTEILIYLYKEFGLDLFAHLRGEFAFILYDRKHRRLLAARDRFGIKPLYFARTESGIAFASEMKALFASQIITPEFNTTAFDPLCDQDPENVVFPFRGIDHVAPGTYLAIELATGAVSCTPYWSPAIPDETAAPVEPCPELLFTQSSAAVRRELADAVRTRLRADVPLGLYLSGGLDSTLIGALMKIEPDTRVKAFSIAFVDSTQSEGAEAQRAARAIGAEYHQVPVTRKMLWENLEDCVWHAELPFFTLAPVGKFILSREASKHVKVVLTGEGADEVFLGYRRFYQDALKDTRRPGGRTGSLAERMARLVPGSFTANLVKQLSVLIFHRRQRAAIRAGRSRAKKREKPTKTPIIAMQERRLADMPLRILCYLGDRTEMAHGLEARLPFLDHHLFEEARNIPVDFKLRGKVEKAILRESAKGILPEEFRTRRKRGFMHTGADEDLFAGDKAWSGAARDYLTHDRFRRACVFSYPAFLFLRFFAKLPRWKIKSFNRVRRHANQALLYIVQVHMLHALFIEKKRWAGQIDVRTEVPDHGSASMPLPIAAKVA